MREFKNVKIDLLSNKPCSNGVIFEKESLIKSINKTSGMPILVNYDRDKGSVGIASNFRADGDYVVADIKIQEDALPTQIGLGSRGELSENDNGDYNIFFTTDLVSVSTIKPGTHLHEGLDILK